MRKKMREGTQMAEQRAVRAPDSSHAALSGVVDSAVKLFLLALMGYWAFSFVRPFVSIMIWGAILAVCLNPVHRLLLPRFGGRRGWCATAIVAAICLLLVVPSAFVSMAAFDNAKDIAVTLKQGALDVPAPPALLQDIPVVGKDLYDVWSQADTDFSAFRDAYQNEIKEVAKGIMRTAGGIGASLLHFIISLVVSGALIAFPSGLMTAINQLLRRLVGPRGPELSALAGATVLSVAKGVLGVALAQAALFGIGVFVMGTPFAGLLTLGVLLLALLQLPAILLVGPVIAYEFANAEMLPAVLFAVWSMLTALSDNVLKPMLLGRGVAVPMLVILAGSIGGMLASGFVGLFEGAVVLAVAYTLISEWLDPKARPQEINGEVK